MRREPGEGGGAGTQKAVGVNPSQIFCAAAVKAELFHGARFSGVGAGVPEASWGHRNLECFRARFFFPCNPHYQREGGGRWDRKERRGARLADL